MNTIANNIRISNLPSYVKCSTSRHPLPELNCYWVSDNPCSYPFILAITGNIATAATFPYIRREYRRTGLVFSFSRRHVKRGLHRLEYSFEIVEKVTTGEKFAILRDVIRDGRCI